MNRTNNYNLCQFEENDQVQRTDFNEDNLKTDSAIKAVDRRVDGLEGSKASVSALNALAGRVTALERDRIYVGSYVGDGADTHTVTLPWAPVLILLQGRVYDSDRVFQISQNNVINIANDLIHQPPHEFDPLLNGSNLKLRNKSWCNHNGVTFYYVLFR